jgi:uncharacterized tellurite resistance protein B-like protein
MERDRRRKAAEVLKSSVIDALEEFFDLYLEEPVDERGELAEHRLRLAAAVLIVEITRADFEIREEERLAIRREVEGALGLTPEEADQLARSARVQAERTPRLHEYAELVDQRFSLEQKKRLVQALWAVAFADAEILPHEEYLVRKVSELLHLSTADLIEAKIRAREEFR